MFRKRFIALVMALTMLFTLMAPALTFATGAGSEEETTGTGTSEVTEEANAQTQTAQFVEGPIRVNGTSVDNAAEPYPLLLFRDVTYFPLTWRFAVNEFGWQYSFDSENGLVITNPDAPFETPEKWQGYNEYGLKIMGTGEMPLFFTLDHGVDPFGDRLPHPSYMLCNINGKEIELLPASRTWECQI